MSTDLKCQIKSTSSDDTENLATKIGAKLRGGEVIELVSDLGGGKTVFTKGLVKGAGSFDEVTSPTFTISKIYHCPLFDIHHFDFYRLDQSGLVGLELSEVLSDPEVVTVIEWANVVKKVLPKDKVQITIINHGGDQRCFNFVYPASRAYLLEDLNVNFNA
jgi:tRNA threonylcarbamoyladenosine biosynthesis protein TsaE